MSKERVLSCCISGSYRKYWPEIRETIRVFKESGVIVREPSGEWIFSPNYLKEATFRPLNNEMELSPEVLELS